MTNIKIKLNVKGVLIEVENFEYDGDIFEFFERIIEFISSNESIISMKEMESQIPRLAHDEIYRKRIGKLTNSINIQSDKTSDEIFLLAKDSRISPDKIQMIFDFGAETKIPPILIPIEKDTRTEQQRIAILVLLYENNLINNEDKVSSKILTPILTKSNIDPTSLSKAFRGNYTKFVKIDGKTYRITQQGILEARKCLKQLSELVEV